jgi:Fibronectin type III domain.
VEVQRTRAQIYWSAPKDCTSIKGPIEGYTVTLKALSPWVNTSLPIPIVQRSADKPYAIWENLTPFTEYMASVFVRGPNGKTNQDLPYSVNFRTLADGECQKLKQNILSDCVLMMMKFMILYLTFEGGCIIPQLCKQ